MQNSLKDKVDVTFSYFKSIIENKFNMQNIFVSWTGGKDSTVVLYLWSKFLKMNNINRTIKALTIDTGFIFSEIKEFMDEYIKDKKIYLYVYRPDVDLNKYPKEDVVSCCRELKIVPLKKAVQELEVKVLLTGIRKDESIVRRGASWMEEKRDPEYLQVNPIIHWTEMDIWAFHMQENLPYCKLYEKGYRSIDCIPCTKPADQGERSGRNPMKEEQMELLHSLGYF